MDPQPKPSMPRRCRCGPLPEECVHDDEYVTQLTERDGTFRRAPRVAREVDFSVTRGTVGVAAALAAVVKDREPLPEEIQKNRVRHARVGDLRDAGFEVIHTPGRVRNGPHVSIVWMGDDGSEATAPWTNEVSASLEACFNDAIQTSDEDGHA